MGVKISDLTEDTTPADGDFVVTVDVSANASKKVTRKNFFKSGNIMTPTIIDTNDNEILKFAQVGSAVNEVTITNAATGNNPTISTTGGGTNINLALTGKGTGGAIYKNPYKFSAYKTAAQNVGTAATKVNFETENYDTSSNYDAATNFRFTAPIAGTYHFDAQVATSTAGSGTSILIMLYKNGSEIARGNRTEASAGQAPSASLSRDLGLAANDYIEVFVSSGTAAKALDVTAAHYNSFSGRIVST